MPLPARDVRRYLNGGCLTFAIALKRELGLPIYALTDSYRDRQDCIHVFVADEAADIAIDARGARALVPDEIGDGAQVVGSLSISPISIQAAQTKLDRFPTTPEINEARALVRRYLKPELEERAQIPFSR